MTKVLLILSALAMAAGVLFAYQNGRTFKEVREAKSTIQHQIRSELATLNTSVEEVNKVAADIAKVQGDVDTESEKLKSNKLKVSQTDGEIKRTEDELKSKKESLDKLTVELAKLPAGFNPQTISEDINKIKQETAELQTQAEAKKQEISAAEKKAVEAQKNLEEIVAKIDARKKSFERNSLKARIVAVNGDWGFVVIDAGQKEGITPDTKLLIIRGTQTVGKLSIIDVQGGRTVANVLSDTLAQGMTPAPGDSVILENLYQ